MFRSSPLQEVNFRSGGKSDSKKKGERRRMFLKRTYSFFFSFFLWLGSGTSRNVVSALNSRADVTSLLVIVFTCFLGSLLSSPTRFTENLSIYLSPPAPNSSLQNPSNFGATASHWLLYFLLFFFFWFLTGWMRGALCVATLLYILYVAADESTSGWEFYC